MTYVVGLQTYRPEKATLAARFVRLLPRAWHVSLCEGDACEAAAGASCPDSSISFRTCTTCNVFSLPRGNWAPPSRCLVNKKSSKEPSGHGRHTLPEEATLGLRPPASKAEQQSLCSLQHVVAKGSLRPQWVQTQATTGQALSRK